MDDLDVFLKLVGLELHWYQKLYLKALWKTEKRNYPFTNKYLEIEDFLLRNQSSLMGGLL